MRRPIAPSEVAIADARNGALTAPARPAAPPLATAFAMAGAVGTLLAVAQLHRAGGSVLAAELTAAGLGGAALGLIMGVMYLASGTFQPVLGLMFDRIGARRTVCLLAAAAVAGTLLFGLVEEFWGLLLGRLLLGIGFAGAQAAVYMITLRWVAPERFATTASIVVAVAGGLGALLATTPLAFALQTVGWRATFTLIAAATVAFAIAVYLVVRDRPESAPAPPRRRESLRDGFRGMLAVMGRREFRLILPMTLCTSAPYFTVVGLWAGPYLRDVHGLSALDLSYVVLAAIVGWNVGVLGYGPLDRLFNTRKGVVLTGAGVVAAALAALALLPAPTLAVVTALLLVFALAAPFQITLAAHLLSFLPQELAGRTIAATQLTAITGIFVVQFLTGLLLDLFAAPGAPAPASAYRLIFGLLAALVVVASLFYARAPDAPPRST